MVKKATNFKDNTLKPIIKLLTELSLAFLLGVLPIWLFSKSAEKLDEMVSGLLAIGPLIDYYAWMLAPCFLLIALKYAIRFRSDRSKVTFNFIHKVVAEAGTGFQTILRTGAGVAIGILLLPEQITTPTTAQYRMLYCMVVMTLISSCAISMFRDEVMLRTDRPTYKNPLILAVKRTKD